MNRGIRGVSGSRAEGWAYVKECTVRWSLLAAASLMLVAKALIAQTPATKPPSTGQEWLIDRRVTEDRSNSATAVSRQIENHAWPALREPEKVRFQVRAANEAGLLQQGAASLRFDVLPYWWQNPWLSAMIWIAAIGEAALIVGLLSARARRRRARRAMDERLRFEEFVSALSRTFINVPSGKLGEQIVKALGEVGGLLEFDFAAFSLFTAPGAEGRIAFLWRGPGVPEITSELIDNDFPWSAKELSEGRDIYLPTMADLPREAEADRMIYGKYGVKSAYQVPLFASGMILASLNFCTVRMQRKLPRELLPRQRLIGEVFANTLMRKLTEDRQRESEARFRIVADAAPVLIWMSGQDKQWTFFNKPWLDFRGRTLEEESGHGWSEGVHPDDLERYLETYAQAFDARKPFQIQYRLRRHDDEYRWVSDKGIPRHDAGGSFAGYIGSCTDITEERRKKDALRAREAQLLKGRAELKDLLQFERLGTDISSMLMRAPAEELGTQIVPALGRVAQLLGFDVATLALFMGDGTAGVPYVWYEPGTPGLPDNLTEKDFPWSTRELLAGRDVHIRRLDDFPPEAQMDRATYARYGLKSALDVPVLVGDRPVGVLRMGSFRKELSVSPQLVERQRVLGNFFGNALVRARSEIALRESEERMNLAADAADLGMWIWYIQTNQVWATERWHRLFGFEPGADISFEAVVHRIHPEDRDAIQGLARRSMEHQGDYATEYRVVLPDGKRRWLATRGRTEFDAEGKAARLLGVAMDITERRRVEEEARELGGRLISAQEDERTRLARELHDDLSQSLALLSVDLDLFGQHPPELGEEVRTRMEKLAAQVKGLSSEVHRLSHELHPSKLEQLGLAAGLRSFCKDIVAAHQIAVHFEPKDVPAALPDSLALCLYRVVQEALHNVVKHSGATSAKVELVRSGDEIKLTVTDDGRGFDIQNIKANGSIGLVSMRERVRLAQGNISWDSKNGEGTRVEVRVPYSEAVFNI